MEYRLGEMIKQYKEKNTGNLYKPVAVGKYGIRQRSDIYKKELAKDYSKNKVIFKNTLTIGLGSNQIDIGILEDDAHYSVSPAYSTFKIDTEIVKPKYLDYLLKQNNKMLSKKYLIHSARQGKKVDIINLLEEKFTIPSFVEQDKVCNLLKMIENLIKRNLKKSELYDEMVKARFVELFGDPETKMKEWIEKPLSTVLDVVGGYAFKSDQFSDIGIPVLRIGNINAGYFKPVNMVYWKEDNKLERYTIYPGDLVMSLTGTVEKDDYGNVCILGNDYDKYYLNQRNAKLELTKEIDKYYLSQLLKFEQVKRKLTGVSRGVRQANISNKDILNLVIAIPPIAIQKEFASFVEQLDKSKYDCNKKIQFYEELMAKMMDYYFNPKEKAKTVSE